MGLAAGADDFLVKPLAAARARRPAGDRPPDPGRPGRPAGPRRRGRADARPTAPPERASWPSWPTTDPLTGLSNRRHLLEALEAQLALAARRGEPLSLHHPRRGPLQGLNDDFGHPAGDAVLSRVAEALRASVRDHDLAARYGGEEFVVAAAGRDADGGAGVAERIRAAIGRARLAAPPGDRQPRGGDREPGPPPSRRSMMPTRPSIAPRSPGATASSTTRIGPDRPDRPAARPKRRISGR